MIPPINKILVNVIFFASIALNFSVFAQTEVNSNFENYDIVIAGNYQASGFSRFFKGDHWRDLWITPIKVPVLDLEKFAGGLTPLKKGGGLQTSSLKFKGNDGRQYKFRSIDKDVKRSLPPDFKESIVASAMQDQISVINPASSLVVARLMDAVEILNARPKLYVMPDEIELGEFRNEFAGILGTLEEDPEDYENEKLNFASADKVVGTYKLFKKLQEDNDEIVDAAEYLKARLLDILIGDRDRHAGQWNWAGYRKGSKRIWKPIPKDRDFAFPLYDGLIPRIQTIAMTSAVHFDYEMPSMLDMTWEGRHVDRRILSTLDKPVWDSVATYMMEKITDQIIEEAVLELPEEYYQLEGDHLVGKLKSRRDQLKTASDEYYGWASKYVDIHCSDKNEYVEVIRANDLFTEVYIYKRNKVSGNKESKPIFHRLLKNTVTDEIRIYLMDGDDFAIITGSVREGCRVIVEGGKGKDELHDYSRVEGYVMGFTPFPSSKRKTELYDSGKKSIFVESDGTYINQDKYDIPEDLQERYEPLIEDRYMDYGVLVPFEYNTDDGFILGIGGRINHYDFRQKPYSTRLDLSGSYATVSKRAEFEFFGDFNNLIERLNVRVPAKFTGLEITRFYGFGNESVVNDSLLEANYYNVNQQYLGGGIYIEIPISKYFKLHTGLLMEFISVLKQEKKLVNELQPYGLGFLDFFALSTSFRFDNRDDKELPFDGYYFDIYADLYPQTLNNTDFFGKIILDGRTYLSSHFISDFTIALRAYSQIAWGNYPFYKGASIGGKKTLRGFPRDRFVGDQALMGSAELRYYLAKIFFLIPFKLGMNLFTDSGRVFLDGESSSKWHTSFGGGFWVSIHERDINFSINLAKSPETFRFYISIGQMF